MNIVNCETRRVIRTFGPHGNRTTDMTSDTESLWLITCCMDFIIRIWMWDVPLVDTFYVSSPCISLSFFVAGEFLATSHSDDDGIYLWSNISLYCSVNLRSLPYDHEPQLLEMPRVRRDEDDYNEMHEENAFTYQPETDKEPLDTSGDVRYSSAEQISPLNNFILIAPIKMQTFIIPPFN